MKKVGIALLLLTVLLGCGSRKDAKSNEQSEIISDEEVDDHFDDLNGAPQMDDNGAISTIAIIRDRSIDNCGFLVEIIVEDEPKLFEPIRLDEAFQVDGLSVNITYRISRRPSNCIIAIPIVLDKIELK